MKKYIIPAFAALGLLCGCNTDKEDKILKDRIGQMLVVGFQGTTLDEKTALEIKDNNIGGIILFERSLSNPDAPRNITDKDQLISLINDLQSLNDIPMFISIDQEGGTVARLNPTKGFYNPPSPKHIADLGCIDSSRYYACMNATQLRELGINMNFTPCIDMIVNPDNPIIALRERAFSDNPDIVVKEAEIVVEEHRRQGIITSLKHFPGHGSSKTDSHLGLTDVTNTFTDAELIPYKKLIEDNFADIVMVSHLFNSNIDSEFPASLSEKTIGGLLRNRLGFNGVVATDDMHMGAITEEYSYPVALELALNAGVDMIIIGNNSKNYEEDLISETMSVIYDLVISERVSRERIEEAYERIMTLKSGIK